MPPKVLPLKTLKEAMHGPPTVPISVCAWVTWFAMPRQSGGKDHYMLLHISDSSLSKDDMSTFRDPANERDPTERPYVTCAFFGPQHMLPQLDPRDPPRIIYLHQTKMIIFSRTKERQLQVKLKAPRTPQDGDTYSLYPVPVPAVAPRAGPNTAVADPDEDPDEEDRPLPISMSHPHVCSQLPVDLGRIREVRRWVGRQLWPPSPEQEAAAAAAAPPTAAPAVPPEVSAGPALAAPAPPAPATAVPVMAGPAVAAGVAAGPALVERTAVLPPGAAPEDPVAQDVTRARPSARDDKDRVRWIRELVPPRAAGGRALKPAAMRPASLLCRVLAVEFCRYPHFYILHIWDGTDAPAVPAGYSTAPTQLLPPNGPKQHEQPKHQHKRPTPEGPDCGVGGGGGGGADEPPAKRVHGDGAGHAAAAPSRSSGADAAAAGGSGGGGSAGAERAPRPRLLPPPHRCRLLMPLTSIAQFNGTAAAAAAPADGHGDDNGWEVLSAVLAREDMPATGSSVPLVLPGLLFCLAPSPPPPPAGQPEAVAPPPAAQGGRAVTADAGNVNTTPQPLPRPGDWIELRRVLPRFVRGQLQLDFKRGYSRLAPRPYPTKEAAAKAHEERLRSAGTAGHQQIAPLGPESWLARVQRPWQDLPLRTLRQVLMQQDTCDCTPARVLVRVMAVRNPPLPPALPALMAPAGSGGAAAGGSRVGVATTGAAAAASGGADARPEVRRALRRAVLPAEALKTQQEVVGTKLDRGGNGRTYALALQLQDATASLRAVVVGGAANLFLWDLPPPDGSDAGAGAGKPTKATKAATQGQQTAQLRAPQPPQQLAAAAAAAQVPDGGAPAPSGGVMTRSRANSVSFAPDVVTPSRPATRAAARAAATAAAAGAGGRGVGPPASRSPARSRPATPAAAATREGTRNRQKDEAHPQRAGGADGGGHGGHGGGGGGGGDSGVEPDARERLVAALRWLSNQRVPGGAWMEAVLRPMYRDCDNPWQSAVYTLEHTVVRLPPHLQRPILRGAGPAAPTAAAVIAGQL